MIRYDSPSETRAYALRRLDAEAIVEIANALAERQAAVLAVVHLHGDVNRRGDVAGDWASHVAGYKAGVCAAYDAMMDAAAAEAKKNGGEE